MAQPIYKAKNGQFSAAVFENEKGKSIALQKSYTDKEGVWKNPSITIFPKDIDKVIAVLEDIKQNIAPKEVSKEASASSPNKTDEKVDLPGGDELVVEEEEEEMEALEIWRGDLEEEEEEIEEQTKIFCHNWDSYPGDLQ